MGSGKPRWKLSFRRSPSSSITTEAPMEFVCPISRSIMADPVIVPSGQTFERNCIQVCRDLAFIPPSLSAAIDLSSDVPFLLIPNVALRSAIVHWCDRTGILPPLPVSLDAARALIRSLMLEALPPPAVGAVSNGEKAPILEGGSKEMMTPDTPPQSVRSSKENMRLYRNLGHCFSQLPRLLVEEDGNSLAAATSADSVASTGPSPFPSPQSARSSSIVLFRPSITVIVGILTTMFSLTFLLLVLYAKHCKQTSTRLGRGGSSGASEFPASS